MPPKGCSRLTAETVLREKLADAYLLNRSMKFAKFCGGIL